MAPAKKAAASRVREAKPSRRQPAAGGSEVSAKALRGFMVARDAISNLHEMITHGSRMAFLAVKDCERELDVLERQIDEELPGAVTLVSELEARELIASLRFITDLERIGDLVWWVAQRLNEPGKPLQGRHQKQIEEMTKILQTMLEHLLNGLTTRDMTAATFVMRADSEMDRVRHAVFKEQLGNTRGTPNMAVLLMAQALERAGDHATNLAEELVHMIEGRSIRHSQKRHHER
jgi:phosphate transport system protein